jgi:hypothetical protein
MDNRRSGLPKENIEQEIEEAMLLKSRVECCIIYPIKR